MGAGAGGVGVRPVRAEAAARWGSKFPCVRRRGLVHCIGGLCGDLGSSPMRGSFEGPEVSGHFFSADVCIDLYRAVRNNLRRPVDRYVDIYPLLPSILVYITSRLGM